ncbi:MAG: hypothetical protein NC432_13140 [Roseburia sp.]|nr:hypothetical protein [Roseburia sp.]MCM1099594.1 hypothetical protein [Ruminococcus flavefaciens]
MASQEDYLDNLLKDMEGDGGKPEDIDEPSAGIGEGEEFLDLDAVSGMTEAEIENLLPSDSDTAEEDFFGMSDEMLSDEDVLKMLEDSGDEDLKEIQDLLEKSDHNEKIDGLDDLGGIDDIFSEISQEAESSEERRKAEPNGKKEEASRKESSAEKRERKKAEAEAKKAEKQAAKEAAKRAKAEKQAAKEAEAAAKKAEKQAARGAAEEKPGKPQRSAKKTEDKAAESAEPDQERSFDPEDMTDMSLLDSILSEAKPSDKKQESAELFDIDAEAREVEEPTDFSFGEEGAQEAVSEEDSPQGEEESPEIDFGDLFPENEDGLSEGEDSFSFSEDTLELDLDEADQLIPERGGASGGDGDGSGKKPLLSKIRDFLTEEDEEENEDLRLSQENQDILNDMKKESGGGGKKAKKGGAAKPKEKAKKAAKQKKPAKPKKAPAPKKQKEPKETEPFYGKKLSFKKMLPVLLVGVSVGVLLFVFVNAAAEYSDKSAARTAFYQGDYDTCYQNLKGKKLDETESIMFGKSECILYSRLWVREYEVFTGKGDTLRALESLIQAVDYYPDLQEKASRWNALPEVAAGYAEILNLLENDFGLTESQAKEIASQRRDSDYTRMITAIVEGRSFGSWSGAKAPGRQDTAGSAEGLGDPQGPGGQEEAATDGADQSTADPLPEEEGIGDDTFIENQ